MKRLTCVVLALAGAAALAAPATTRAEGFEQVLPVAPVELAVDGCRVDVEIAAGVEPALRITGLPGDDIAAAGLSVAVTGGGTRVARDPERAAAGGTVTIELVLDPAQPIQVVGHELEVSVRSPVDVAEPGALKPADPGPTGEEPPNAHRYDLTDSQLHFVGKGSATITARNTAVHGESGSGALVLELERGSVTLRRHRGALQIRSRDSECRIQDLVGGVSLDLNGGGVELSDGSGSVHGTVRGGFLTFDRWSGSATLEGEEATVEVRDGSLSQLKLTGAATNLTADGARANIIAQLAGGSATVESVRGTLEITADADARVDVEDHQGRVTLTLRDGSSAEVRALEGGLTAAVDQSELVVDGARTADLTARDARLTLAGVRQLQKLDARSTEMELDLRDVGGDHLDLRVVDGSSATVELASPCRVQLRESAAASQQVDVTGCEFQIEDTGRWRGGSRRGVDGRPTFLLTAKVSEDGSLRVRGGP